MTTSQQSEATTYSVDPTHSRVSFAVRHLMLSKVRGEFTEFTGTVQVGSDNLPTHVSASIAVSSIDTHASDRDTHLKSPDFFDADKFPTITFESTNVHAHDDTFKIHGNLTIRGTTKPVELTAQSEGKTVDPWGKNRVAFSAWGKINRKDFGVAWNQAMETGGVMVGEEVDILLDVEAVA